MLTVETTTIINTQTSAEISNLQRHSVCSDTKLVLNVTFCDQRTYQWQLIMLCKCKIKLTFPSNATIHYTHSRLQLYDKTNFQYCNHTHLSCTCY